MRRSLPFLLATALVTAAGCLPRTSGELDNGGFSYICQGNADLACHNHLFDVSELPPAIAVGAHFDLRFVGSSSTSTRLVSVAPQILAAEPSNEVASTGFRFTAPGTVGVLAQGSGVVVDFVHLTGAAVAHVAVVDGLGDTVDDLTLSGSSETLEAIPRDALSQTLAGALHYTWTSSDEDVVSVEGRSDSNKADLSAGMPGTATITVKAGDGEATVAVTVGGEL